eukprot:scaffold9.g3263.t1
MDLGERFSVCIDDSSGAWPLLQKALEARGPLRQAVFSNKFGQLATVDELHVQYLPVNDPHLQKLRQFAHSSVAWFRHPYAQLVLVSCEDYEEYKRVPRLALKALADAADAGGRGPAAPELVFVYLRPPGADPGGRGPAKVFDAMRRELSGKRRERCVRLDPPAGDAPGAMGLAGMDALEQAVKEAIRASFEARVAAYEDEASRRGGCVRRLMSTRLDPTWSFTSLFLVKDSLAVMMEAGGMLEDALREHSELEACYLEALEAGQLHKQGFGGKAADDDEAALLWAPWRTIRDAVQARVAERGLAFVCQFGDKLARRAEAGSGPRHLKEAWSFAAATSLAAATSRMHAQRADARRSDHGRGTAGKRSSMQPGASSPRTAEPAASLSVAGTPGRAGLRVDVPSQPLEAEPGAVGTPLGTAASSEVDWELGSLPGMPRDDESSGEGGSGASSPVGSSAATLYCLLGELYATARTELAKLGDSFGMQAAAASGPSLGTSLPQSPFGELTAGALDAAAAPAEPPGAPSLRTRGSGLAAGGGGGSQALGSQAASGAVPAVQEEVPSLAASDWGTDVSVVGMLQAVDLASDSLGPPEEQASPSGQQEQPDASVAGLALTPAGGAASGTTAASGRQGSPSDTGDSLARRSPGPAAPSPHETASGASEGDGRARPPPGAAPHHRSSSSVGRGAGDELLMTRVSTGLSVRIHKPPAGGFAAFSDSPPSTPRSPSAASQASSASPARGPPDPAAAQQAAAQQAAAQHAAQARPAPAAGLDLNDPRLVEHQVSTPAVGSVLYRARGAFFSRGSRLASAGEGWEAEAAAAAVAGPRPELRIPDRSSPAGAHLPPWLVHWRLRVALAAQPAFGELWCQLSEAAARCFAAGGRRRTAAVFHADVADALTAQGQLAPAATLYERQARAFLREGWLPLAARTLPRLAACQVALGSGGLPYTAAAMLALPPEAWAHAGRDARGGGGAAPGDTLSASLLLLQAARLPGAIGGGARPLLGGAPPDGLLHMSPLLVAYPTRGRYSRFFGQSDPATGTPQLLPSGGGGGAAEACVGDVVVLQLEVESRLPVELPLAEVALTLAVLQELTVTYSPRASPGKSLFSLRSGLPSALPSPGIRAQQAAALLRDSASSAAAAAALRRSGGQSPTRAAVAAAAAAAGVPAPTPFDQALASGGDAGEGDRYVTKWQQVEELRCLLIDICHPPAGGAGEASPTLAGEASAVQPARRTLALHPGRSVLRFLAAPIKRGLYVPLHVRALLHELPVHLTVKQPDAAAPAQAGAQAGAGLQVGRLSHAGGRGAPLGAARLGAAPGDPLFSPAPAWSAPGAAGASADGSVHEDMVLMSVAAAAPRVSVTLASAGGAVIAGQRQWLGLAVRPAKGVALGGAALEVMWPLPDLAGAPAVPTARLSKGTVSASALLGSARGPHRRGESLGWPPARGGGAGPLQGAAAPMLRPERRVAALAPLERRQQEQQPRAGEGGSREPAVASGVATWAGELVFSESAAPGSAAWLLGEGHRQELALPLWASWQRPLAVWWWVEAGEFVQPPEVVKACPAAPRHPSRLHDLVHHLALTSDPSSALASPPALLDLAVNVQYASGCARSHARVLPVPVRQPFAVAAAARELPGGGGVAVQFTIASQLEAPAVLRGVELAPQPGFEVSQSLLGALGLLPAPLGPRALLTATFLLACTVDVGGADRAQALAKLAQAAKLQPSALSIHYAVEPAQQCSAAAAAPAPDGSAVPLAAGGGTAAPAALTPPPGVLAQLCSAARVASPWRAGSRSSGGSEESEGEAGSPVAGSPTATANGAGGAGGVQVCRFRHLCVLELPAAEDEDRAGTLVFLRLLGPFTAVAGRPTTLCWRLERSGAEEGQQQQQRQQQRQRLEEEELPPPTRLHYEVSAEGDGWRPLGRLGGAVSLGAHDGAVATVEATWLPLAPGMLPMPVLHLADVQYQEVFDPGSTRDTLITVLPPPPP